MSNFALVLLLRLQNLKNLDTRVATPFKAQARAEGRSARFACAKGQATCSNKIKTQVT